MLVQRISVIAVCTALLAACGTNNVNTPTNIPVADPLHNKKNGNRSYITQHQGKTTAQQYALKAQRKQQVEAERRKREQAAAAQRRKWEAEHARRQREAQQQYEAEKQRIARLKHQEKYKQEQIRLAQQKLEAEKLRLTKLKYQREWEAEQKRKEYERKAAEQRRLAAQREREAEQRRLAAQREEQARKRQQYVKAWEEKQQQARNRQNLARTQQARQTPYQRVALQGPTSGGMYRGPGRVKRLPSNVAQKLRLRGISTRGMSVYVRPANGRGPAVLTAGADVPRNPASTMKLVTTYAALGTLGGNYRWPTEIYTTGQVAGGTLRGDVIIKGYGDPDFKESDLRQLLQALRNRGIRNIAGNLVTDISYFNVPYQNPGAFDGKARASYNAQPEALLYQGRGSNYKFRNLSKRVKRRTGKLPRNPRARADINTNIFGAFWKVWVGQLGGHIQGDLKKGFTPRHAQLVHRHHSKPLRVILREINKDSNNVMARQLMLTIGAQVTGNPGTPSNGAMAIGRFLESRGLRFPELRIENGSGLSRVSRISARHLGEMLVDAHNSPWRGDFTNSLAVLGVDGTLRNRMKKTSVRGRGRFKTGTLRNVRGLAGYVQASDGQTYVVSILHNDRKARSKARSAHDELVKWVYWGQRGRYASAK